MPFVYELEYIFSHKPTIQNTARLTQPLREERYKVPEREGYWQKLLIHGRYDKMGVQGSVTKQQCADVSTHRLGKRKQCQAPGDVGNLALL